MKKDQDPEKLFKKVFQQSPIGIAQVSPQGDFIRVNHRFCQIIGYKIKELIKMNFRQITYQDDLHLDEKYIREVLSNKRDSFDIEKRYIHKDGHPVWIHLYSNVIRDENGDPEYAIASILDITERKMTETALKENEQKFKALVDQSPGMLFLHDMKGNIIEINQTTLLQYGYSKSDLLNMKASDIDPDYVEREDHGQFWDEIHPGEVISFRGRHRRKDGSIFPVEVILSKINYHNRNHILALAMDISEQKHNEQEIVKKNRELEKYQDQLEKLVQERTRELEEKNKELEHFNSLFVGREFRIRELKDRVDELEKELRIFRAEE